MWFGTGNGLARFDGYEFIHFPIPFDSAMNLKSQVINDIFEGCDGKFWIGTSERGLFQFDRTSSSFKAYFHDSDDPISIGINAINSIFQDLDGLLWFGTSNGLIKYDASSGQFVKYLQDQDSILENQVNVIFEDSQGWLWIGTDDGVSLFDREKQIFTGIGLGPVPASYRKVTSFFEDSDGLIWIGTYWGLYAYNRSMAKMTGYQPIEASSGKSNEPAHSKLSNIFVEALTGSKAGKEKRLWIATKWGLNRFDPNQQKFNAYHHVRDNSWSLSTDDLRSIYLDDSGLLWIGTINSGINILNTAADRFHEIYLRLPENKDIYYQPASFLQESDGSYWIGGVDEGLFHYDQDFNFLGNYKHWTLGDNAFDERQHNQVQCIYEDPGHNLWLGYYIWGLVNFDRVKKTFRHIDLEIIPGNEQVQRIFTILADHSGYLWIGTDAGLFFKKQDEEVLMAAHALSHNELSRADIIQVYEDKSLNLWISTRRNGLYCMEPGSRDSLVFDQYQNNTTGPHGFNGYYIASVYEDSDGNLWLGSDAGLNRFKASEKRIEPEFNFNVIHAGNIIRIYGDKQGCLWILHESEGLIRYRPFDDQMIRTKVFDISDGLPFDNFNIMFHWPNVFYQDNDGRLFLSAGIGTNGSFFWFHPDSIADNFRVPPVMITGLNVQNKLFQVDSNISSKRHIKLKYNQNFFSFKYAALDYLNPAKNQYAYYLDGLDNDWITSGHQRSANYTGIPPGNYTFRVKGANNDGYWNAEGAYIHLTVLPPFWKTWWAFGVYGLIIVSVMYLVIHYYLKRQRLLYALSLEHMEAEKLKELDSLKSRFFANISHEFRTPLTLILGPLQKMLSSTSDHETLQDLSIMQRNASRLQGLINQLLDLSRLDAGRMELHASEENVAGLVKLYVQQFESFAKQMKIDLVFTAEKEVLPASVDRDMIEKILFNMLGNAFKYTGEGGRIEVAVSRQKSTVSGNPINADRRMQTADPASPFIVISVGDTGTGILPDKLPHIFDRFYQADDTYTRHQEGTGIGLALTRELVELHHGWITVESEYGAGSTFRVFLPASGDHISEKSTGYRAKSIEFSDKSNNYNPQPVTRNPQLATAPNLPLILIVEDNSDLRLYLRGIMSSDYSFLEASDGQEGLELAVEHVPELVLTDVMMPRMDGYELTRKLKSEMLTGHIPVILLTARASKESRLEGLETGADDFVTKPFDSEELLVRVKNLIHQRKQLRVLYRREFELIRRESPDKVLSMDERFLQKAKAIVQKNLADPEYSAERFASDMALSRSQLHRKLIALIDQPVTEFIRTIRLNYAAALLAKRAGTISEIAYDAGFNNPTYFSISFKLQFGVSPSDYLAQQEKQD
jgi:signal transduction histidine kinase/ligand-binding sensor domain-containing protein/DNA-binding response OmpR family regulator